MPPTWAPRSSGCQPATWSTGLTELAREHRVSHLVLGRDVHRGLAQRFAPDITDRLLAALPELELHLVAG